MNTPALPAYLQNRQSQGVAARATSGMGSSLPPHISIRGNSFTLVDAAGNQQPVGAVMDACVVDISDQMNKRYYENDWTPGSDEPPTCWSSNGIGPSRESIKPQSPTCGQCQWNIRGSDTSKISGKPIKACRDEMFAALLLPQYPSMLFQIVIPPGSFKNWQAFNAPFGKGGVDPSDVLIRFGFQPQVNGVMTFAAVAYIDEATFAAREQALIQKATDALVGRNDVPIAITHQPDRAVAMQPALAAPYGGQQGQAAGADPYVAAAAQFGGQPQAQVPFGTGIQQTSQPAANAGFGSTGTAMQHQQPQGSTSSATPVGAPQTEQPRRTRRTQAQIAADNAAKAAAQAGGNASPGTPSAPVQPAAVPFPVNQPQGGFTPGMTVAAPAGTFGGVPQGGSTFGQPGPTNYAASNPQTGAFAPPATAPTSGNANFGIQNGQDPNVDPQLAAMLASIGTPQ